MEFIHSAFFCTTPFQIITSIVLTRELKETSDLYIVPQFNEAAQIADNIRKEELFNRVILVDTSVIEKYKKSKWKQKKNLGIVLNYLKVDKIAESILAKDTFYAHIFLSSKANIGRLIYLHFVKSKLDTELVYFDDGEGSYDNERLYVPSKYDALIRRILFGVRGLAKLQKIYLYSPALYHYINPDSKVEVVKIPELNKVNGIENILNHVFDYTPDELTERNCLILDILYGSLLSEDDINNLKDVYSTIVCKVGSSNALVKPHPRNKSAALKGIDTYQKQNVPFEVVCCNRNLNSTVLVSVSSTAAIIPKLLFDQEPTVILLYKIIKQKRNSDKREAFYTAIGSLYNEKHKFFVPQSISELNEYLEKHF